VVYFYEKHCIDVAFICSDANSIYTEACDLLDIPHHIKLSNYNTVIKKAGYIYADIGKPPEERKAHNRTLLERLYQQGEIDYISHWEDLDYAAFSSIKNPIALVLHA
jgi:hypothetical protein